jgi:ATP-binding cassette subfamily B protein
MGFFGGLDQDSYDRKYSDKALFGRIYSYFDVHRAKLIIIVAALLLVSLTSALFPIAISYGLELIQQGTQANTIVLLVFGMLILGILNYILYWARTLLTNTVVADVVSQMRKDGTEAAVNRDLAFYDENKSGKIISRITSDTQEFNTIALISTEIVAQFLQVAILLIALFRIHFGMTIVLLLQAPLIMGIALMFRHYARIATRQGVRAMAVVNDNIQESVTGISVAKNFRREAMIYDEFVSVNLQSYQINLRRGFVLAMVFPVLTGVSGIIIASVLYLGATTVVAGAISVGAWFLYIQAVDRFFFPFISLSVFWSQIQQGLSAVERVFALIDAENTVVQTDDRPAENLTGRIEFKDVVFKYKSDTESVLKNFNLTIQPGEGIAFVGHTGAGKSTIAKLIARFYEFQEGEILIDGQDIRSFDLTSYRQHLGIVPQAPFLFSGTILDNIRYGKPDATDGEIDAIAHSVGNGEWLETMPDGLLSDVGERGAHLSMGQRQLVSLLRVLVQKPAIFILDEATASIDPFTEAQIQEALDLILSQSTSILIAHRLSTVRSADRIIVLREGSIIEEGGHDSLMGQGGHYAELYNTYFRHQSLSYIESARDRLLSE